MVELIPNTSDGANEKHVPVITREGQTVRVQVGSVAHPMLDAHYIEWIALETRQGMQRKLLEPGKEPVAVFALVEGDEPVAAYEYCNLHGFWKAEV
jgi:superoxide reductase